MSEITEQQLEKLEETIHDLEEERKEHNRDEKKYNWIKYVALTTALIAVLTAIATLQSNLRTNQALLAKNSSILSQAKASDQWAYYQAKGIKGIVYETQLELLEASGKRNPLIGDFREKVKKYKEEQSEIKKHAEELERQAEENSKLSAEDMEHHHGFALAEVLFQVAIALSSVAAMTRRKELWFLGLGLSVLALLFFADGFFLFF
ncbi:MAG TPA: DUF4337 domain-containing protein [Nitrospiria bacterium]|nr:DUF4337 domain-containing protein [Nitrospiria bacterium]